MGVCEFGSFIVMNDKVYIIVTYNVCNQGGAQLYVLRRAKYLKQRGYEVRIIVSFDNGNFILKDAFSGLSIYYYPELSKRPLYYSHNEVDKITNKIISDLNVPGTNVYIESHTLLLGLWAEEMAFRLSAKHVIYCLSELPSIRKAKFFYSRRFFEKKYETGGFYGCSSRSIEKIFGKRFPFNNYVNIGFDERELVEISLPKLNVEIKEKEFILLTITRLDKTYVEPLIHATCQLAEKYPQQKFRLIIAGGSKTKGREEYLFNSFSKEKIGMPNLEVNFTGYINTLGKDIFRLADVFIGMGTASINAISQRCLTLNIDPLANDSCSGFFGMDTTNPAYPDSGRHYTILDKMEQAYNMTSEERESYINKGRMLFEQNYQLESCFEKLDKTFDSMDVVKVGPSYSSLFHYILRILKRIHLILHGW